MADHIVTLIRPATRPAAQLPTAVQCAYLSLIARLGLTHPHKIVGSYADAADIEERGLHLTIVMNALTNYVGLIADELADLAPAGALDARYIRNLMAHVTNDLVGHLAFAAEEIRKGGAR